MTPVDPRVESPGAGTLGLGEARAPESLVSVAIDAAGGAGDRAYTYRVPDRLRPLDPGEAVVVEFGHRQALGIILGPATAASSPDAGTLKPVQDRVRADGPLLPPLGMALAAWIAAHYLAPPALVLRAMLPPGLLERLELVAEVLPTPAGDRGPLEREDSDLVTRLELGPQPVRRLPAAEGRPALLRRLRALAGRGWISLDWTLTESGAGPRYTRIARLASDAPDPTTGDPVDAAPTARRAGRLGARQVAALADLRAAGADGLPTAVLADRHGGGVVRGLLRRGLVSVELTELARRPLDGRSPGRRGARPPGVDLAPGQADAVAAIDMAREGRDRRPILLDGVTGSGKTAIYAAAIAATLTTGRPALLLVPEIALALPIVDRLRADLDIRVALLHSGLSDGERSDEWRRIRRGGVDLVVGTRLAVLAPLASIGLVIVDEEHDPAYKSDRTPRIQARDVALRLAELAGAPAVLGSATPAVDTEGRARAQAYRRVHLPSRLSGAPPSVEIVDLRAELEAGNRGMLSRPLAAALAGLDLEAGEQAVLVINRRGTASAVLCRDCGHVQACPDCERPLVYHQAGVTLRCHHCGRVSPLASRCPNCGSPRIRYLGGGTERLEREVRERFPSLRVARLDRDVVARRGAAARVIDAVTGGRVDVVVGTSLVTKGLDVPTVTLVGVVSADVALNLPDERATERTYQLLVQAVGRAGRGERPGRAFLQTYEPDHPAIRAVTTGDPAAFYDAELELRRAFGSPPFGQLVKLTVALPERGAAEAAADGLADELRSRAAAAGGRHTVAGPAPAYIARRADRWRFNVVIRGPEPVTILDRIPGPPWSVDVDPESLL